MKAIRVVVEILGIFAVLGTVGLVVLSVFDRFVLESALRWSGEVSTDLFVWVVFLGAALSAIDDEQLRFATLLERPGVPDLARGLVKAVELVTLGVTLYFLAEITYLFRGNQMTSLNFTALWALVAPPIGVAIVFAATCRGAYRLIGSRKNHARRG